MNKGRRSLNIEIEFIVIIWGVGGWVHCLRSLRCSHYSRTRKHKSRLEGEGFLRVVGLGLEDIKMTKG